LARLLDRPAPPEHILIETSGLALPKPLVQAFSWPEIRTRTTVDGVLTVIDGAAVAAGMFADDPEAVARQRTTDPALSHDNPLEEVFSDQLACADLVILNKTDLIEPARLAALSQEIEFRLRPGIKLVTTREGRVPAEVALGLAAAAEDDLASRPSIHELEAEHERLLAAWPSGRPLPPALRELPWMLEELRVSHFAQSLGVRGQVSSKRIRRVLEEAD
jgi:cobalamin biosynthesis protein CobW